MKEIQLSKGYVALVDDADFERVSAIKWHASISKGKAYAKDHRSVAMHSFILGGVKGVDHGDGDGLNNQRYNLRPANQIPAKTTTRTPQDIQNSHNRRKRKGTHSLFKGVSWHGDTGKWAAYIKVNGRQKHLGLFRDDVDAAQVYNFMAEEHFGEFALLNTPDMENTTR